MSKTFVVNYSLCELNNVEISKENPTTCVLSFESKYSDGAKKFWNALQAELKEKLLSFKFKIDLKNGIKCDKEYDCALALVPDFHYFEKEMKEKGVFSWKITQTWWSGGNV